TTQSTPQAAQTLLHLCDALFMQNKAEEAWAEYAKWQASLAGVQEKQEAEESVRMALDYMAGNLDKLCQPPAQANSVTDYFQLHALLGLRKTAEILGNDR